MACYICPIVSSDVAPAIVALYVVSGMIQRLLHGGLARKWVAHVVAAVLAVGLIALSHWWPFGLIVGVATWVQWMSPTRDFSKPKMLIEAHLPWACVSAVALWSPMTLPAPFLVAGGYWAFQRWVPDHPGWFWKPTICAESFSGAAVWGLSAYAVL